MLALKYVVGLPIAAFAFLTHGLPKLNGSSINTLVAFFASLHGGLFDICANLHKKIERSSVMCYKALQHQRFPVFIDSINNIFKTGILILHRKHLNKLDALGVSIS